MIMRIKRLLFLSIIKIKFVKAMQCLFFRVEDLIIRHYLYEIRALEGCTVSP
jgi:hypothetical protein